MKDHRWDTTAPSTMKQRWNFDYWVYDEFIMAKNKPRNSQISFERPIGALHNYRHRSNIRKGMKHNNRRNSGTVYNNKRREILRMGYDTVSVYIHGVCRRCISIIDVSAQLISADLHRIGSWNICSIMIGADNQIQPQIFANRYSLHICW